MQELPPLSFIHVLFVEDSATSRTLVELTVSYADESLQVEGVGTVAEALSRIGEPGDVTIDAVLLDLGLPDASGLEALDRIHAVAPSMPMVVLTSSRENLEAEALARGADVYLRKPADGAMLAQAVRQAVQARRRYHPVFERLERVEKTLRELQEKCKQVSGEPVEGESSEGVK